MYLLPLMTQIDNFFIVSASSPRYDEIKSRFRPQANLLNDNGFATFDCQMRHKVTRLALVGRDLAKGEN